MMLVESPAVIFLSRRGQQHSWELHTNLFFNNKYMQKIFSKKNGNI